MVVTFLYNFINTFSYMKDTQVLDWVDLATKAGYLFRSPHILGGMIYSPEGLTICDNRDTLIKACILLKGSPPIMPLLN